MKFNFDIILYSIQHIFYSIFMIVMIITVNNMVNELKFILDRKNLSIPIQLIYFFYIDKIFTILLKKNLLLEYNY